MLRPIMDRNDFDNTLKASCAAQIVLAPAGTAPEWIQLTPLGAFETVDGRKYTVRDSAAVIAASKMPAPVDYDHGTDTGTGSRAAGWMEELQPQGPKGEPGLWARMKWTDNGAKAIAGHEYRFISPTFIHDKANIVTRILRAGLLNNPAIGELPALASQQENELDQIKQIAVAMGLPETATLSEILAAITAAKNNNTALASRTKLLGEVATAAGLTIAGDKIGETEVTAICAKLKTPAATGRQRRNRRHAFRKARRAAHRTCRAEERGRGKRCRDAGRPRQSPLASSRRPQRTMRSRSARKARRRSNA
jgi:phage I-like protein